MTGSATGQASSQYRIRVGSHLDDHWSAWFGDVVLVADEDGTTTLTAVITDQAALRGLLAKVMDLGVPLMSLEVLPPSSRAT